MGESSGFQITRRAFASALSGAAAVGVSGVAVASVGTQGSSTDADLRDAALRGLALADARQDPVRAKAAAEVLEKLDCHDPEAGLLVRIYRRFDVPPASYWLRDAYQPDLLNLERIHNAVRESRRVRFSYTDLQGEESTRSVLPLALVHPAQGVKLLAWCDERQDFRQFFVRSMTNVSAQSGEFAYRRLDLLRGLLDKYA